MAMVFTIVILSPVTLVCNSNNSGSTTILQCTNRMGASICVCFQTDVWAVERVFYLCISHADVTCLYHPCLNIIQWEYIGSFGFGFS